MKEEGTKSVHGQVEQKDMRGEKNEKNYFPKTHHFHSGNVYVADAGNHRIQKFTSSGGFIGKWGTYGTGDGALNYPYSGMYNGFTAEGVYNVAVFARDGKGTLSLPVQTSVTVPASTDCLAVASDLSIRVPCAEYSGNEYGFTLGFYRNPDDPSGYYWNLIMATLTTGEGTDCILFGSDLSMPMSCVSYNGAQYGFTLRFYNNPYDPSGYYWKMDMSTLVVK